MTAPGGGEPHRDQPGPWQPPYQPPPVDLRAPVNYPDHPPYPPPGGYPTFGGYPPPGPYPPPPYPGAFDPYLGYRPRPTNSLAVASLVTSLAGVVLGIPLAFACFLGWLIPVVGAVLGGVALSQIKRTGEQGHGMAVAGIAIGATTATLLVLGAIFIAAVITRMPTTIIH